MLAGKIGKELSSMISRIHIIFMLLTITIALTFSISDTSVAKEVEIILSNPDFESGTAGWSLGAEGTLSIDKKEKFPIGNVMLADIKAVGADDWVPEIHSTPFDVEIGVMYTCSFWAKADAIRTIGVKYEQLDTWVGPAQTFTIGDGELTEYSFSPIMTMGSPPQVVIHIQFNKQKGKVWFAHFRVYEGKYVEDDLVANPKIAVTPAGSLANTWGQIKH